MITPVLFSQCTPGNARRPSWQEGCRGCQSVISGSGSGSVLMLKLKDKEIGNLYPLVNSLFSLFSLYKLSWETG